MPELLIINPGRKVKRKTGRKAPRSAAQKAATRRMIAANRSRAGRKTGRRKARRSNPAPSLLRRVSRGARRVARRVTRRRRNPISLGSSRSYIALFKDALIEGGGAVAVDYGYSYVEGMMPAMLQRTPGRVGLGDAVKAVLTVAAGRLLSKPTRGLSMKAARGALTVQAHGIVSSFVPGGVAGLGRGRMGWAVAAPVINGTARVGPNGNVGAYLPPGQTPLLSGNGRTGAYMAAGQTALLNGVGSAINREGFGHKR